MNKYLRVLVVGRRQENADMFVKMLEDNSFIATTALSGVTAMDLALSSDFDVVVFDNEVKASDRGFLATEIINYRSSTIVITANGINSVLTQIRQAFREAQSALEAKES